MFDLSIIIINWKSRDYVRECLRSIYNNVDGIQYEVIVVDNASYDGCAEMVQTEFSDVVLIQSEKNLGFAGANNLAFERSRGRYVLFLNPDTEIQGAAIQALYSALESIKDAGMVGAHLLNSDRSVQTTCVTALPSILNQTLGSNFLRKLWPNWHIWGMQALNQPSQVPVPVEAISGACMMARRELIEEVHCFSTSYFMYLEDMDLCLKIANTGSKIYYVPQAVIVHHGGGSSSSRKESNFSNIVLRESSIRYFELHHGNWYAALYRISIALMSLCRIMLLGVMLPVAIRSKGYQFISRAASKWSVLLIWSLGLRKWEGSRPI